VKRINYVVGGGGVERVGWVSIVHHHHTFFLLASAYSHGTQKSHYCLLATTHANRVRIYRVVDLLRCKSVFPAQENHINTEENAEQKLNQPTGVNYLLTINHHYYYPKAAAAVAVEQVSGMVIIISMTWELKELKLLVQLDGVSAFSTYVRPKDVTNA